MLKAPLINPNDPGCPECSGCLWRDLQPYLKEGRASSRVLWRRQCLYCLSRFWFDGNRVVDPPPERVFDSRRRK